MPIQRNNKLILLFIAFLTLTVFLLNLSTLIDYYYYGIGDESNTVEFVSPPTSSPTILSNEKMHEVATNGYIITNDEREATKNNDSNANNDNVDPDESSPIIEPIKENVNNIVEEKGQQEIVEIVEKEEKDAAVTSSSLHISSRRNHHQSHNHHKRYQCLSFENELDNILQYTKQVFITMPAKASGSSLKAFTKECTNNNNNNNNNQLPNNNFMKNETFVHEMIRNMYDLPQIIACHVGDEIPAFLRLIKGVTDESLIIYVYRDETDRLLSSIKMAASHLCKEGGSRLKSLKDYENKIHREVDKCIIEEDGLRNLVQSRKVEIGKGIFDSLSCSVFQEINDSRPRIVFMNYKQADKLQIALAKHYCPNLISSSLSTIEFPIHRNDGASKVGMYVKTLNDNTTYVTVDEWGQNKKHYIEFALGLKSHVSCQARVRKIEKELSSCRDELIWY